MVKKIILILFLTTTHYLLTTHSFALELQSPRFKLEFDKSDIEANKTKSVVYTIETLQGREALKLFKSRGLAIKKFGSESDLIFSLSPALIDFGAISPGRTSESSLTLSVYASNQLNYYINTIQAYPLKNLAGDTIDLSYSISEELSNRKFPNQNKGEYPTLIMSKNSKQPVKITFSLDPPTSQPAGTYETIINFIAIPSY